jgi:hypothetical protein
MNTAKKQTEWCTADVTSGKSHMVLCLRDQIIRATDEVIFLKDYDCHGLRSSGVWRRASGWLVRDVPTAWWSRNFRHQSFSNAATYPRTTEISTEPLRIPKTSISEMFRCKNRLWPMALATNNRYSLVQWHFFCTVMYLKSFDHLCQDEFRRLRTTIHSNELHKWRHLGIDGIFLNAHRRLMPRKLLCNAGKDWKQRYVCVCVCVWVRQRGENDT